MKRSQILRVGVVGGFGVLLAAPAFAANIAYQNAVVTDGATVYYNFDSSTPTDVMGGTTAVIQPTVTSGATSANSALNTAYTFGGGDVRIAHSSLFDLGTGAFSIEMWFDSTATTRGDLFNYKNGTSDMGIFKDSGTADVDYYHSGGIADTGNNSVSDNAWHYLVLTRTAAGAVTIYIDTVAKATGTDTASINNTSDLLIGSNYGSAQNVPAFTFSGQIDEFAWYPTALTQNQINNHFALAPEPASLGLLALGSLGLLARRRGQRR